MDFRQKGPNMAKKVNHQTNNATLSITTTKVKSNVKNPIYYQIEDGDIETIKYYKGIGVPVHTIAFPGRPAHLYALVEAKDKAEADAMNRVLGNMHKEEIRAMKKILDNEASYDQLLEDGYDPASDKSDPSEIVIGLAVTRALFEEVEKLSEEKQHICQMIGEKKSECEMASKLEIAQTTLHDRKAKTLKELSITLKEYK